MIKAIIQKIDLDSGIGLCKINDNLVEFNLWKLQDGDSTNYYALKEGIEIYFDNNTINDSNIDRPYYLFDLDEEIELAKKVYGDPDRSPLIGDLIITPNEGMKRIASVEDSYVQSGYGKPYLFLKKIHASYSGGLDYPVSLKNIKDTGRMDSALFWTFKSGARANNGIDFELMVKVWIVKEEDNL